jgi:hypothetical protein
LDPGDEVEHLLDVSAVEDGNVLQQREVGHVGHRPRGVASGIENVDGEVAPANASWKSFIADCTEATDGATFIPALFTMLAHETLACTVSA